ncbi:hypothetical protein Tco_1159293 [Tanacetum coccineum]
MLKKFGLEDSKPTKTPMSTEIKLTKDDKAESVDNTKYRGMIGSLLYLTASRPDVMFSVYLCARFQENPKTTQLEVIRDDYIALEDRFFHEGRYVEPSFIEANNMLPLFRDLGLESFLTLDEQICPRFVTEVYYSFKLTRDIDNYLSVEFKLERVKQTITVPRTTQNQLKRDPNKLFQDDLHPELKGLFKHILKTNPQSVVPLGSFTLHQRVMNPLDIPKKTIKNKGKSRAPPSPPSSPSFNEDEEPSFMDFYEELPNDADLIDEQKEKRGMFKCMNRYIIKLTSTLREANDWKHEFMTT